MTYRNWLAIPKELRLNGFLKNISIVRQHSIGKTTNHTDKIVAKNKGIHIGFPYFYLKREREDKTIFSFC